MGEKRIVEERVELPTGKIIGMTKVKNMEGMAIKLTLDNGIYLEVTNIQDAQIFESLCRLVELEEKLRLLIEKG